MIRIINADVMDGLAQLADESVQCVVTSPPYWGLRDYGVDGQIGLEPTPDLYVTKMVEVFREVRRVLRSDGVCWLNLGDSYASIGRTAQSASPKGTDGQNRPKIEREVIWGEGRHGNFSWTLPGGIKSKDLVGIPWMTAFALRADGWWLRQEIIWAKPNPMPESVTDRCTKAHEHIFLLTKSARYFYDAEAIAEPRSNDPVSIARRDRKDNGKVGTTALRGEPFGQSGKGANAEYLAETSRNKRSVWTIATQPYAEAHFATFPEELPETCIKAGSKPGDTILDPFAGAGTTGLVADKLGRNAILIELSAEYAALAERRIKGDCPMFASVEVTT